MNVRTGDQIPVFHKETRSKLIAKRREALMRMPQR
jgi:hypothetical protein